VRVLSKICAEPAKCCGAPAPLVWHSAVVSPNTVQSLAALCPTIKKEWAELLRGEPTITPLGRPDTLVYLMDATLAQLFSGLDASSARSTQQWLRRCTPLVGPAHTYCACGLNPLLKYFTTGELALHAAAGPLLGSELDEVLLLFRALAQQEIQTLCSVCQYKGVPGCCEIADRPPGHPHPHPHPRGSPRR
jgi:hypothetical protein